MVSPPPESKSAASYARAAWRTGYGAPEGIAAPRVEAWFQANVPGAKPPLVFERVAGGRSNLTYRVDDAGGRAFALRRPPLGKRLGSAHDMARERKGSRHLPTRRSRFRRS